LPGAARWLQPVQHVLGRCERFEGASDIRHRPGVAC
jgi:hypothetical protein